MIMRKLLFIVAALSLCAFVYADRSLYFIGKNALDIYHALPFGVKTRISLEGKFGLWERDDFGIMSIGKYNDYNIEVDNISKYGYNEDGLILEVNDVNKVTYYFEFKKNTNSQLPQEFVLTSLERKYINEVGTKYKWVVISDSSNVQQLIVLRLISLLLFLVSTVFLLLQVFIQRERKQVYK